MTISAPRLPEIDEHQLDDKFYRCVDMAPAHIDLLNEAESKIKNFLLESHKGIVKELKRVEERVPSSLFKQWTKARLGWDEQQVAFIRGSLESHKKKVDELTEERNKLIVEMRANGKTQKQAAEAAGVGVKTVRLAETPPKSAPGAVSGPPKKMGTPRKFTEEQELEIVRRISQGDSRAKLGKDFGVSPTTISNVIKRHGSKPPAPASNGSTVAHSNSNHSPRLQDLRDPEHSVHLLMKSHRRPFFMPFERLFKELDRTDKALLVLQNLLGEDFSKYHGAMLARWAAYQEIWGDDLHNLCGGEDFKSLRMYLEGRLKATAKRTKEALSILERIESVSITIEQ